MSESEQVKALLPAVQGALAIVAGNGDLPRLIAENCQRSDQPYRVVQFEGIELDWTEGHQVVSAIFEKPGRLFSTLRKYGCDRIAFAGGIRRPRISPLRFDFTGIRLAPKLFKALRSGDDAALRIISEIFETQGLRIIAAHELLSSLLAPSGVMGEILPSDEAKSDAARANEIVLALGQVDVGQAAIVGQGICLGIESIQGTDQLLSFVAETGKPFLNDPDGCGGVLLKAPKPGQDWRTDLPAIGPDTIENAAKAGLEGVVVQAGGVLVLGLEETIKRADELGLFLWGRAP